MSGLGFRLNVWWARVSGAALKPFYNGFVLQPCYNGLQPCYYGLQPFYIRVATVL